MGKTYKRQPHKVVDEFASKHAGKQARYMLDKKLWQTRALNNYVEEDEALEPTPTRHKTKDETY